MPIPKSLRWGITVGCLFSCSANGAEPRTASAPDIASPAIASPAAPTPEARPAPPQGGVATNSTLTAAAVSPHFASGVAKEGARLYALENFAPARAQFVAASKEEKDVDRLARLQLMIALCDSALGAHPSAATGFAKVAARLPLLADFAQYRSALAHYEAGKYMQAMGAAGAVSATSIYSRDAALLVGDLLRVGRKWKMMADHYRDYLNKDPDGYRLSEARFRYAQAFEKTGAGAEKLIPLFKEVASKGPLTRWASKANERIGALTSRLPSSRRKLAVFTAAEHIDRGLVLYRNHRNEKSEAAFEAALAASGLDVESRCVATFHRANSVYKQRNRPRAAPLFEDAIKACNKSKNADLQVKSYYQAGRCYGLTSRSEIAVARYGQVEKRHPSHSYADDSRLRAAEEYRDIGDQKNVTRLLSSLPTVYPQGDMRAEAMWRLAWRAFKAKDYDESLKWLRKQIEVKPIEDNYYAEGQAQYWMGRAYAEKGDAAKSLEAYRQTVLKYPMSYYTALALNRVRESNPAEFKKLVVEIQTPEKGYDPKAPAFRFRDRAVYKTDEFRSALELLRLGLGEEARRQLGSLGFVVPPGKREVTDADEIDKIWAMAFLYHHAGQYTQSHWVTRWHVLDYKRRWPAGHNLERWRIAFPMGWWDLLKRHADGHGYPPELLISFVREESAFNPLQESFANAIGLTQMIFGTARRFAKGTGIVVSRGALRDPEKNVTIGGRFLNFLYKRFDGRVSLAVPSYNAGEGATDRWLRYRGDWAMDAWAEEVPYDETRRYSKRVIATFFTYNYLRNGVIPVLPNTIPAAAITQANRGRR